LARASVLKLPYMRQSQLFTKTERNAPKDEATVNAQLLARAGFVSKLMAGVYSYLPLGLRVLNNIENIVREEMNAVGGQEVSMPIIHPKSIWMTTGGWDKIDVLFKVKSRTEKDYALGQSEEEVVTPLVMKYVNTYKDLPKAVYQINWKFRDELRSKSGLLRGVEFLMKDMYSFHATQEDFERYFAEVKKAYFKIFDRLGLTAKATEASGGAFTQKISYEFMVLTDAGEDDILYCDACEFCVNAEIAKEKEGGKCTRCGRGTLAKAKASEVGNVFDLGQKFSKDFDVTFNDKEGKKQYPIMGCYGIGISRLMGVIVEKYNDDRGIVWPEAIAPFAVHLLAIAGADAEKTYDSLQKAGIQVLYDDREMSAGEKFAEADLIGIPWRIVVSPKLEGKVEIKKRNEKEPGIMELKEAVELIKNK
jgi:prolyl-tRNA synthetase